MGQRKIPPPPKEMLTFWPMELYLKAAFASNTFKIRILTGEMARSLRVLAILSEDLCSVPSPHMAAHNCL